MPLDGSNVISSTALAPGTQSFVTTDGNGGAWVAGDLSLPLLPVPSLSSFGNSFALHLDSVGPADLAARFGGVALNGNANATAPVNLTSIAMSAAGDALIAGAFAPIGTSSLTTQLTFDLPLVNSPTTAFPASVHEALLPPAACTGSLCAGSAAYLASLNLSSAANSAPSLALSIDDAPNVTLRNLGSAAASGLQIAAGGFSETDNCGPALTPGAECGILLGGNGPGSISASAANATAQIQAIPAIASSQTGQGVVFSPKELDFGIAAATSPLAERTVTVTNLSTQTQTFSSAWIASPELGLPFAVAESSTDCTLAGSNNRSLLPGASCHITISLTPSSNPADDGIIQSGWMIGSRMVRITGYGQAAGLTLSASELRFGTQYAGGLRLPRYVYLSNSSGLAVTHQQVTLPVDSPFSVRDECPDSLAPGSICRMRFDYESFDSPSSDSVTVALDQGLTLLLTGQTHSATATAAPLTVSDTSVLFAAPVVVSDTSSSTQSITLTNPGESAVSVSFTLTGTDFSETNNCGAILTAGDSCSVVFSFAPSVSGLRQGVLSVGYGGGALNVSLSGTGYIPADPVLTLSPSGLAFVSSAGQDATQQAITVTNPGPTAVAIGQPTIVNATAGSAFAAVSSCSSLEPSSSCILTVTYTAGTTPASASLVISATGSSTATYTVPLAGDAITQAIAPLLQVSPASLSFGPVGVGSSRNLSLQIANNSAVPITDLMFQGADPFTVVSDCATTLVSGASCSVSVNFAPTSAGEVGGALNITSNAASPVVVPVNGMGAQSGSFSLLASGNSSLSVTVKSGSAATFALTVAPSSGFSGNLAVSCTAVTPTSYGTCSAAPTQLALNGAVQTVEVTVTPDSETAQHSLPRSAQPRGFGSAALTLLFPTIVFTWEARTPAYRTWRKVVPSAWTVIAAAALLTASGCAGTVYKSAVASGAPEMYQYQITAATLGTAAPISETVVLNLTVTP